MSHDGTQTFVFALVESDDVDDAPAAIESREGASVLTYRFGFGETHPITPEHLDALVALPWVASEDESVRFLGTDDVVAAVTTLGALMKRPAALSASVARALECADAPDAIREAIAADATEKDALTDGQRLAQVAVRLHRVVRRAAARGAAVAMSSTEAEL